jgi:hypothetical protein
LVNGDPSEILAQFRIAAENDRRDVSLDLPAHLMIGSEFSPDASEGTRSGILRQDRNGRNGETIAAFVFDDEVVPALESKKPVVRQIARQSICLLDRRNIFLE